ncbi:MAG: hypothetical protein KDK65_07905, partial [Chlamydiia bacterium]|nr:hypothetical protein [Chlamydiia bacterium]
MKWACLFLVFLYLLTLNGYMMPQGHDDVIYYQAAKYMAKENAYPIGGIPEWGIYEVGFPPGFPFLMALLMKMGITSV